MFEESFKASSLSDKLFTQFHALLEKGEYVTLLTFLERYRHDSKSYKTILKEKSLY